MTANYIRTYTYLFRFCFDETGAFYGGIDAFVDGKGFAFVSATVSDPRDCKYCCPTVKMLLHNQYRTNPAAQL